MLNRDNNWDLSQLNLDILLDTCIWAGNHLRLSLWPTEKIGAFKEQIIYLQFQVVWKTEIIISIKTLLTWIFKNHIDECSWGTIIKFYNSRTWNSTLL